MKLNTFKKYEFTADLFSFLRSSDSTGGTVLAYFFDRQIQLNATTSGQGRLFVFLKPSEADVIEECRLHNIRDAEGLEVRPGGVYTVTLIEPLLNIWGRREGYKGRLTYFGQDD